MQLTSRERLQAIPNHEEPDRVPIDLGGFQSGPLFSPAFYRAFVKPQQRRVVDVIKERTPAKIWYHTCGSCRKFIPEVLPDNVIALYDAALEFGVY